MPKNPERFRGLLADVDPKDVPMGYAVEQRNAGCLLHGRLDVRKGVRKLKDSWSLSVSGTARVISLFGYVADQARWVVMQMDDGSVKAVRNGATINNLITGLNTNQPLSYCVSTYGHLIMTSGLERGYIWDGVSTTASSLGIKSPEEVQGDSDASPTITDNPDAGGLEVGVYYCGYRYIDANGQPSNLSELAAYNNSDPLTKINWSNIQASDETRIVSTELWRSLLNDPSKVYKIATIDDNDTTYTGDSASDEDLLDSDIDSTMAILTQTGKPYARRFTRPPVNKPYVAQFQDVTWYYGRLRHNAGTVAGTSGGSTATFTGASLRTEMNGWKLVISGTDVYTISAINEGAGTGTVTPALSATYSGASYVLVAPETESYLAYYSARGESESVPAFNAKRIQQSGDLTDIETGLMAAGPWLYFLHERHFYTLTFQSDPALDSNISSAGHRGCINNRCHKITLNGRPFLVDQLGGYFLAGNQIEDVTSDRIRTIFSDSVDWTESKRKWYFVSYEPNQRVVRFHCQFTGDGHTHPKRALCYSILTKAWWDELYPLELSDATQAEVGGLQRLICGGTNDNAMLMFEGYSDIVAAVQGSPTSAVSGGTGLTNTTDSHFTSAMVGAPVTIISGTGKGTTRTIASYSSSTVLAVDTNWTVDTTSVYVIGGINASIKTGGLEIAIPRQQGETPVVEMTRECIVQHKPTSSFNVLDVKVYENLGASSVQNKLPIQDDRGVIKWIESSDVAEVELAATRAYGSDDPGYTIIPLGQATAEHRGSDRYLQLKFEWTQGVEAVPLMAMDFVGLA